MKKKYLVGYGVAAVLVYGWFFMRNKKKPGCKNCPREAPDAQYIGTDPMLQYGKVTTRILQNPPKRGVYYLGYYEKPFVFGDITWTYEDGSALGSQGYGESIAMAQNGSLII